ncbi:YdeI/OmpD-associated family protein [Pedobacter immunditicola]|uniref:YdeI/OmpD-associated family protein n=1 Tax=Pedobacter immunditicola TaxID=3133440 RepID=UPI0030A8737C
MEKDNQWQEELALLKSIILKTGLTSTIKWGMEVYTHNGKNVVGALGFKNYFALWFYNGVFLKDEQQVLVSAQDGKTKALRHWRFTAMEEINETLVLEYIHEAIKNEEEGKVWKPQKSAAAVIPELLSNTFLTNKALETAFEKLSPYKQKEYIEHIDAAKREETKKARLEKITPMILQGVGLNDKYKNC